MFYFHRIWSLAACCILLVNGSAMDYDHFIYIDCKEGNNTRDCLTSNGSFPCLDLNWVIQQPLASRNSTHVILSSGTHILSGYSNKISGLNSFAISGRDSIIACRHPGSGLVFNNIKNLVLTNVTVTECATVQNRSIQYFINDSILTFQVGIFFNECENITLAGIRVRHSPNATGVVLYNVTGKNIFKNCEFTNNSVRKTQTEEEIFMVGGGGMFIDASFCLPGNNSCLEKPEFSGTEYRIVSCLFEFNEAGVIGDMRRLYPYILELSGLGCGGGISIFVRNNASGISLLIEDSVFSSNSATSAGGGVYVQLNDAGHGNSFALENSYLFNNTCPHAYRDETSGGAVRFQESVSRKWMEGPYYFKWNRNRWMINGCLLEKNWALKGGGISIVVPLQTIPRDDISLYTINNTTFKSNMGKLGSALYLEQFWKNSRREGEMAEVYISGCQFNSNTDKYSKKLPHKDKFPLEIGIGTVYVYASVVNFTGNNTFSNNYGSAIALSDSNALFDSSNFWFLDNYSHSGAAIALFGASTFSVTSGTAMRFENNFALVHGGAIYSQYLTRQNLLSDASCFIRHRTTEIHEDEWNVTMIFVNNTDHSGSTPNAIYTTSVWPCVVVSSVKSERDTGDAFCWKGWRYYESSLSLNKSECRKFIDTDVGIVKFNDNIRHVKAFPGWDFRIPITVESDYGKDMSNSTIFNLRNNYSVGASYNWGITTSVSIPEKLTVLVQGETVGEKSWYFKFYVDLQPCPPGFVMNSSSMICQCALYGGSVDCNDKTKEARITSGMWMGRYGDQYYVAQCPVGYCNENSTKINLPNNSFDLSEKICSKNRKGYLCGECVEDYGPPIDALMTDCVFCKKESLAVSIIKYIFSVYVPLGIVFSFLIVLDIRLTTGVANGFILYSQVVSSTFGINADGEIPLGPFKRNQYDQLHKAYKFPYGVFNLRFIEQITPTICLSPNLNSLDILLIDYVVAFFPIVMIIVVILVLKIKEYCCDGRCAISMCKNKVVAVHNALLPAFAAFLVFSYSRVSTTSAYLISATTFIDECGNEVTPPRLYLAGQFSKDNIQYFYYFVPGVLIFCTFVTFVPLLLLDFPLRFIEWLISKSSRLTKLYPSIKINILMETFQGCFHKNTRFFAGLYILYRLAVNISYVNANSWLQQYIIQQVITTIFILLLSLLKPYKRQCLNYVDILIFANLAIINSISLCFYVYYKANLIVSKTVVIAALLFQHILIFLPLIVMCSYIFWQWKFAKLVILKCLVKIGKWFSLPFSFKDQELYTVIAPGSKIARHNPVPYKIMNSHDAMDTLWERAEDTNRYRRPRRLEPIKEESDDGSLSGSRTLSADSTPRQSTSTEVFLYNNDNYGATDSSIN